MNIPQTPRQRMKNKALEQKAEIEDDVKYYEGSQWRFSTNYKPGQYEQIFGGKNEIQSD